MQKLAIAVVAVSLSIQVSLAQTPQLVKNIETGTFSGSIANPEEIITINGIVYFTATNPDTRFKDLWKTNGTSAGTVQITNNLFPFRLTNCNGILYFVAYTAATGFELFKSDGTAAGTQLVKDILSGFEGSEPTNIIPGNAPYVYFTAGNKSLTRRELWVTDGTNAGTIKLTSFDQNNQSFTPPANLCFTNNTLFFSAGISSTFGIELWKSNGAPSGTVMVKDIFTGPGASEPTAITAYGNQIYFSANNDTVGHELWRSDGTAAGTLLVKDLKTNTFNGTSSSPRNFITLNNILLFTALDSFGNRGLWRTDGLAVNTQKVSGVIPNNITKIGTLIYFSGGNTLYKSNGTDTGTVLIKTLGNGTLNGPSVMTEVGNTVFFVGNNGTNGDYELWKTNGTEASTVRVIDIRTGSNSSFPSLLHAYQNKLIFSADDGINGKALYNTDGTINGTQALTIVQQSKGSGISSIIPFAGKILLAARDSLNGNEPWISTGKPEGTSLLKNIVSGTASSNPTWLTAIDSTAYFNADQELWKTDGTTAGTISLSTIFKADDPTYLTAIGNTLYFNGAGSVKDTLRGFELWKTDGTAAGTVQVKDIAAKSNESNPRYLTNLNGTLYFVANDNIKGNELWKSNGTDAGTTLVRDINTVGDSFIDTLIVMNNELYFNATDQNGQYGLWKSNGTSAGTQFIKATPAIKQTLTVVNGELFYFTYDNTLGFNLWKSNGTTNGTVLVKSFPSYTYTDVKPASFKNKFYFAMIDSLAGIELWSSDGTSTGTALFKDIRVGRTDSYPTELYATADYLYFSAIDDSTGREAWRSDGTPIGTKLLSDLALKGASSSPKNFKLIGENLYFTASTSTTGNELWRLFTGCIEVDFTMSKQTACVNDSIYLAAQVTNFTNDPISYSWDFGDASSTGNAIPTPTIVFNTAGTKTVSLNVTTTGACRSTIIKQLTIVGKPTIILATNNANQCKQNNNFLFAAQSNGENPKTFNWSFGDNSFSTLENPTHSYTNAGNYPVKLVITSKGLCKSDTAQLFVNVVNNPTTPAINGVNSSFKQAIDTFSINNAGAASYIWTITNGTQLSGGTSDSIIVKWDNTPQGTVRVVAKDSCESSPATKIITLNTPTGIASNTQSVMMEVYPNPCNITFATLQLNELTPQNYQLRLFNAVGQVVYTESIVAKTKYISHLIPTHFAKGMYILEVQGANNQRNQQKLAIW